MKTEIGHCVVREKDHINQVIDPKRAKNKTYQCVESIFFSFAEKSLIIDKD